MGDIAGESSGCRRSLVPVMTVTGAVAALVLPNIVAGCIVFPFSFDESAGGVDASGSSSGIVGQYVLSTCLSAGRRIGFDRKKSMPESRHSYDLISISS